MNRPAPVPSDNIFIQLLQALRRRRVPIALRIVSHSLVLVSVVMLTFAWLFNLQVREVMQQQSAAVGESLKRQTVASATELLAINDLLSLKVMLDKLAENPLVAHVVIHGVDKRIIAEAGRRPPQGAFGTAEGVFTAAIAFQEVAAGQLHLTLDMQQFRQPLTIGLQNFGLLGLIALLVTLTVSLRLGGHLTRPLQELRLWLRAPDDPAPASERQDELGDLARQLQQRLVPPRPPAEEDPDLLAEDDATLLEGLDNLLDERRPAATRAVGDEAELDAEALGLDLDDLQQGPATALPPVPSAVLATRLGAQEELQRRLPQARLAELLQRYRDCVEQAARLHHGHLLRLADGSSLILFHGNQSGEDYLTRALCCGELLRALGHALQVEVADSGLTLQLQLALSRGEGLYGLPPEALLQHPACQSAFGLSQHSRNLLLLDQALGAEPTLRQRARLRTLASPAGASCIERLQDPLPARLERQLGQLLQHA
ncbi:histidine kinase [Pseudomonas stutzeri]|nr:histidine kinase [Stutzerimonas stutzeri]